MVLPRRNLNPLPQGQVNLVYHHDPTRILIRRITVLQRIEWRAVLLVKVVIRNQVPSCGFKIDFTITSQATGKSLAIECDGPMHFQDEGETVYVDSDMERQEVLEKAGWQFYRIRYSDWLEKSEAREDLMRPIQAALLG